MKARINLKNKDAMPDLGNADKQKEKAICDEGAHCGLAKGDGPDTSRWGRPPMKLLCLSILLVVAICSLSPVRIHPCEKGYDETFYLAQALSMATNRDWDLANDLKFLGYKPSPPWYGAKSEFSIGPSLFMTPPLAWCVWRGFSDWSMVKIILGVWSAIFGILAVCVTASALKTRMPKDRAWLAATAAFFVTPAWYYSFYAPGYSHGASAFAAACFVWVMMGEKGSACGQLVTLGVLLGAVYLMRWADVLPYAALVAVLLIVTDAPTFRWEDRRLICLGCLIACVLFTVPFLAVASIQWSFWHREFGDWFLTPQNLNEGLKAAGMVPLMRWFAPRWSDVGALWPETAGVLLSVALLIGSLFHGQQRALKIATLMALCIGVYLQMACSDYGGLQYGLRRLTGMYPLVALGLGCCSFRKERR